AGNGQKASSGFTLLYKVAICRSLKPNSGRMRGLVQADIAAAGQAQRGGAAPVGFRHRRTVNPARLQRLHGCCQMVAHQVEHNTEHLFVFVLLDELAAAGMYRHLCRRHAKNQPVVSNIHIWPLQHVTEEGAVRVRIFAVEEEMHPGDHAQSLDLTFNVAKSIRNATQPSDRLWLPCAPEHRMRAARWQSY